MDNVLLVVILILAAAAAESYFLWKRRLIKEMAFSLLIWVMAAVYAALVLSPLGDRFSLALFIIKAMNSIYGLF